jgi:hypothetical protein
MPNVLKVKISRKNYSLELMARNRKTPIAEAGK